MSAVKESAIPVSSKTGKHSVRINADICLIALLFLIEILTFGPALRNVGFYLDDWLMLSCLHFGPQDVLGAFSNYFFNDPKVIIRPVEVLHFAPMYLLFGLRPLGYHLVNGALELLCVVLLYAVIKRFCQSRLLAFVAVCSFITYPIRDSTHYWILCSSVALSLALFLGSLLISIEGAARRKPALFALSALPFALSIYNYEVFMPFAVLTFCFVFFLTKRTDNVLPSLKLATYSFLPLVACGGSLFIYQRLIVPRLGVGYLHTLKPDIGHIFHEITEGAFISSPLNAFPFLQSQVELRLTEPFSAFSILTLCLFAVAVSAATFWLIEKENFSVPALPALELAFSGLLAIVVSLAIFGLNKDYEPTLMTLVNRIFAGAAVGWSFIFAVSIFLLARALRQYLPANFKSLTAALISFGLAFATVYFTVANWQLGNSWQTSYKAQKDIAYVIKMQKGKIKHPDTIVLANTPRYVMWSPVFDGVWDFQSMVRMQLEDPKISAGVVTERLFMFDKEMKDISMNYTCGVYPYEHLKVLLAGGKTILPAPTGQAFVSIIEKQGKLARLAEGTTEKWRRQLAAFPLESGKKVKSEP